jgi:hypothetical protein
MSGWVSVPSIGRARLLLVLPCNDGAAHGNSFVPLDPLKKGWNTWREADRVFAERRQAGEVFFAAVDSSVLDLAEDRDGALVWETEMSRVRNPKGDDWGAPEWRFYDPRRKSGLEALARLTESLRWAIRWLPAAMPRFAVLDPIPYFIGLAAAVREEGQSGWWSIRGTPDSVATRSVLPKTREEAESYLRERRFESGIRSYPTEWVRRLERLPKRWRWSAE